MRQQLETHKRNHPEPSQGKSLRRPGFLGPAGLTTKSMPSEIKFRKLLRALIHTAEGNRLALPITATKILLATEAPNDWKGVSNDDLDRLSLDPGGQGRAGARAAVGAHPCGRQRHQVAPVDFRAR